jgi:branched-chain amino acid transport system substrate-binding protein
MKQGLYRSLVWTMLLVLFVGVLSACGANGSQTPANQDAGQQEQGQQEGNASAGGDVPTAKIGVVSYISGDGAAYGEAITNGFKLAQKELNEKYKDQFKIDLVIEDSAGKKENAINAVNKLINQDQVVAILGPTLSDEMFAAGPIANENGVPILGTSTTAEGITDIGEYVFRNSLPEAMAIPASIDAAIKKFNLKKVALMYGQDSDFTVSGYKTMDAETKKQGLEILTTETYATGDTDFSAQLTKIKSLKPDAIFISALYKEGALILKKAREIGLDVPVVGGNGFNSPQVVEIAGAAADGVIVATPWFPEKQDEAVQTYVKKYQDAYGKIPDQFAAQAYDALYIMAQALADSGDVTDREKLRDSLANLKDFEGVTGSFKFDENRDPVMNPVVLTIKDGKFIEFK